MDDLIERYPREENPVDTPSRRSRKSNPFSRKSVENKSGWVHERLQAARRQYLQNGSRNFQRHIEALERKQHRSYRTAAQADFPRGEVPPCMLPPKTRKMLATLAAKAEGEVKDKATKSSRRTSLEKLSHRLLGMACSTPKTFKGLW
ncbi:hypothetical protein HDZ31DRAFT_70994 [Schizophyllum fasciatum]